MKNKILYAKKIRFMNLATKLIIFLIGLTCFGSIIGISNQEPKPVQAELHAPWRARYLQSVYEKDSKSLSQDVIASSHDAATKIDLKTAAANILHKACVMCKAVNEPSTDLVIAQTTNFILMLNRFPYACGHFLIVPRAHVPNIDNLSQEVRAELMELVNDSQKILKEVLKCGGINVGINLGKCAGATIPDHVHIHVVPRNESDLGFLQSAGNTNVISCDLKQLQHYFIPHFQALTEKYKATKKE